MVEILSIAFYLVFFGSLGYWFCNYFDNTRGIASTINGVSIAIGLMIANDSLVFSLDRFIMNLMTFGIVALIGHIISMSLEIIRMKRETKILQEEIEFLTKETETIEKDTERILARMAELDRETQLAKHYGEVGGNNGPN